MSPEERRIRYWRVQSPKELSKLLDEMEAVTELHRKALIRLYGVKMLTTPCERIWRMPVVVVDDSPQELEYAARVDGLGYFGIFQHIVVSNSIGLFISLGSLGLIRGWNVFLWPLVVDQSRDTWTVQVVLSTFLTAQTIYLPAFFMGVAIGVLPIIIIFFVVQRYIVEGVKVTGIK
jgi:ABC-type glycerol-3-phosphate transport system permease component